MCSDYFYMNLAMWNVTVKWHAGWTNSISMQAIRFGNFNGDRWFAMEIHLVEKNNMICLPHIILINILVVNQMIVLV